MQQRVPEDHAHRSTRTRRRYRTETLRAQPLSNQLPYFARNGKPILQRVPVEARFSGSHFEDATSGRDTRTEHQCAILVDSSRFRQHTAPQYGSVVSAEVPDYPFLVQVVDGAQATMVGIPNDQSTSRRLCQEPNRSEFSRSIAFATSPLDGVTCDSHEDQFLRRAINKDKPVGAHEHGAGEFPNLRDAYLGVTSGLKKFGIGQPKLGCSPNLPTEARRSGTDKEKQQQLRSHGLPDKQLKPGGRATRHVIARYCSHVSPASSPQPQDVAHFHFTPPYHVVFILLDSGATSGSPTTIAIEVTLGTGDTGCRGGDLARLLAKPRPGLRVARHADHHKQCESDDQVLPVGVSGPCVHRYLRFPWKCSISGTRRSAEAPSIVRVPRTPRSVQFRLPQAAHPAFRTTGG